MGVSLNEQLSNPLGYPLGQTDPAQILNKLDSKIDKLDEKIDKLTIGQTEIKGDIKALDERLLG